MAVGGRLDVLPSLVHVSIDFVVLFACSSLLDAIQQSNHLKPLPTHWDHMGIREWVFGLNGDFSSLNSLQIGSVMAFDYDSVPRIYAA